MDFGLSPEHAALQDVARQFVDRHCPPRRAKEWDESGAYPAELFKAMAEMGWYGLPFPEESGGEDGGPMELAIIAEQLGRASLDIAMCYIGTLIPSLTVYKWGTDAQREAIAAKMIPGDARYVVALSEPDTGSDAAALRCAATDAGDHFVINGQKMWCTGAGLPGTHIMMYVRTSKGQKKHDGISLVLLEADTPGVELRQTATLARHILGTYEIFLNDVIVPKENLVGEQDQGWRVMLSNLELERVLMSGAYVGVAQATLDEALEFSKERTAFGRPIGNFQALAHAMADMQTEIDAARLLAYRAAWMLAQGLSCAREGAMAKLKGSETYVAAARLGMQICAGHGFATDSVMSFRWRESIVAPISGGTSQIQRNGIARSMGLRSY
ncbi:acyl-CoA dehydrogenase family protein [Mycobacterium branderi]|uniref:Acyl-CoA dehydrogenase n=1 Tax=Mycobacterium branderi TaxID=43348 RepID=A0A7I7WEH2_9MYCO|nr:acyl-CoA dehydrogenase family protein [Mycobacterium branderi]MCV7231604.1 acyl-CoA/acyl-ACP dehydrogenase [Mycobacterium branderi]ORA40403.1 acyl-CoA dehydrogenase [Mycobacterium branderi]BBZ14913.1 acyl-CoA dehydrogenase [Mycobacterium branderi]